MFTLNEDHGRFIDTLCKVTGTIAGIAVLFWGVYSYRITRADTLNNASIDARKPVFEKQLDACLSAVSLANAATSSRDKKKAVEAKVAYEALYRNTFMVIADEDMFIPASNLDRCFADVACTPQLGVKADELINGCRKSI